jgi:hypothetical protein
MFTSLTAIISSIVAVVGFLFGVYQYRRNLQLSAFRVYADKYNSILTPDIYEKWSNALRPDGDKENRKELAPTMLAYLNLVWEEMYLVRNGVISKVLWRIWEPEIREIVNTDFAKDVIEQYHYHLPHELLDKPRSRFYRAISHRLKYRRSSQRTSETV